MMGRKARFVWIVALLALATACWRSEDVVETTVIDTGDAQPTAQQSVSTTTGTGDEGIDIIGTFYRVDDDHNYNVLCFYDDGSVKSVDLLDHSRDRVMSGAICREREKLRSSGQYTFIGNRIAFSTTSPYYGTVDYTGVYTTTRWAFLDADNETTHSRQIGTLRLDVYRRKYRTKGTDLRYAHLEDLLDWDAYWQRPVIRVGD
jgi:hypothetical protein